MIEGYNTDGNLILFNPRFVLAAHTGGQHGTYSTFWANVVQEDGTTHRFKAHEAERVVAALRAWRESVERRDA